MFAVPNRRLAVRLFRPLEETGSVRCGRNQKIEPGSADEFPEIPSRVSN